MDLGRSDAAPSYRFDDHVDGIHPDRVDCCLNRVQGRASIDQCAEKHVAGRAGQALEPCCSHGLPPWAARRATRAACTPAPKPLSMFTTTTPGAQEFSMASSAASPSNEAP